MQNHPDRGRDQDTFMKIAKDYEACVTHSSIMSCCNQLFLCVSAVQQTMSRERTMRSTVILMDREQRHFGIALPSWIVDKDNSFLVSMTQFWENLLSLCFGENHNFANVFQSHIGVYKPLFFWWSPPRGEHIGVNSFAIACTVVEICTTLSSNLQLLKYYNYCDGRYYNRIYCTAVLTIT